MPFPISVPTLGAVLTLLFFLSVLNFFFWHVHREDRTPLWLAGWLAGGVAFALCRLLQYAPLSEGSYVLIARPPADCRLRRSHGLAMALATRWLAIVHRVASSL